MTLAALLTAGIVFAGVVPTAAATGVTAPVEDVPEPAQFADDTVDPAELLGHGPATEPPGPGARTAPLAAPAAHTIDVAVVTPRGSGSTSFANDASITALISGVNDYWRVQSDGLVASVVRASTPQRYTSAYGCGSQQAMWNEASGRFGRRMDDYLEADGRHLLVLVPSECRSSAGVGLGTVGYFSQVNTASGGMIWAALGGGDVDVVAHEFGHNLGLEHSNTHVCPSTAMTEGSSSEGCSDVAYGDSFDVMGLLWSVSGRYNAHPTALNITHKRRLGAVRAGSLADVTLSGAQSSASVTRTLASTGASSGLQALRVVDPVTGQEYFVDFRGGGGADDGSLYSAHLLRAQGIDVGVRVLTTRGDGSSVVLLTPDASATGTGGRKLYLTGGQTLSTRSGGVTVSVQSIAGGAATVSVTLSRGLTTDRIFGADRYATALAVAEEGYPGTAPIVYLAAGTDFPDALGAAPAAAFTGGPLLLTPPDRLPAAVLSKIDRLNPAKIVVVGGARSISDAALGQVRGLAPTVIRVSGADRFETARQVVAEAFDTANGAYLASARNFPDALAAAAAAGAQGWPVILVDGLSGSIDASTRALLSSLDVSAVTVTGGSTVMSEGIVSSLRGMGLSVDRRGGADRFETARLINESAAFTTSPEVFLAMGYQFPDALAGAALAGSRGAPLYIAPPNCVPRSVLDGARRLGASQVTLIGGTNALDENVARLTPCR
ncbi:cell wall-binding repeat-containing protein [Compostimonas suwonensis]|nr:cell wall-binding repeat-containing protein [Compostimonas suwonensis]